MRDEYRIEGVREGEGRRREERLEELWTEMTNVWYMHMWKSQSIPLLYMIDMLIIKITIAKQFLEYRCGHRFFFILGWG